MSMGFYDELRKLIRWVEQQEVVTNRALLQQLEEMKRTLKVTNFDTELAHEYLDVLVREIDVPELRPVVVSELLELLRIVLNEQARLFAQTGPVSERLSPPACLVVLLQKYRHPANLIERRRDLLPTPNHCLLENVIDELERVEQRGGIDTRLLRHEYAELFDSVEYLERAVVCDALMDLIAAWMEEQQYGLGDTSAA